MSEISNEKTNETLVEDLTTSKEATEKKNDKKKKTIIGIIIGILVLIIAFLLWFFLRRFPVTFDFNNGTENEIVKVRYNQLIDEEDIKTKEDLGEKFIDWYEVVEEKDGVEYLAEEPFDFTTKIKRKLELKAVYEGKTEPVVETPKPTETSKPTETPKQDEIKKITVTFDSRGGSKVDSVTLEAGKALTLPANPTKEGYTFKNWEDKNSKAISNNASFNDSCTLYAVWERLPETITLSVDNPVIHPYGTKFKSQAQAVVQNSDNSKVTYTFKCDTGDISGLTFDKEKGTVSTEISRTTRYAYKNKRIITITATLPSGTSASVQVTVEPTLTITYKNVFYDRFEGNRQKTSDYGDYGKDNVYTANQKVSWQHGFKSDEATRTTITDTTATYSAPKSVPGPYLEYKATTPAGQVLEIETEWAIN